MKVFNACVAVLVFVNQASFAADPDPREQFTASLQALAQELTIPGLAYAVIRDGKIVSTGQLGTDATSPPLTVDTPLRFASVTKVLPVEPSGRPP